MIPKQTQSFTSLQFQREFLAMSICLVFFTSMIIGIQAIHSQASMKTASTTDILPSDEQEIVNQLIEDNVDELEEVPNLASMVDSEELSTPPTYSSDLDIGSVLSDRENEYGEIFEPWKSKAAIHAIKYDETTGFLALGGGYLYDNEVHVFRLNVDTGKFDKVWECGDSVIQGDVMALAFGDTDLNDFMEIIAGSSDGHIYVFEQRHIYDPYTNTENMFDLVWVSPYYFRVFDIKVDDVDRDYRPDIIAGTWNGLHLFEYDEHSGYPFVEDHWITYRHVWDTQELSNTKIYSLETGDTNVNGLPEIIVGTRDGTVYVYENAGLSILINGYPFPLIRDNFYHQIWSSENYTWTPILDMALGELDGTIGDELAIIAQGQGLLTLQWNNSTKTYDYRKVVKAFEQWETFGYWGLDRWVDRVISANNVTYHDQLNATINVSEPINYTRHASIWIPDADVYPYNTGMAMAVDGNYTTFDSSIPGITNATAIVDFGLDEEGTGSASADPDVIITFRYSLSSGIFTRFNFSISQDGTDFEQVTPSHFAIWGTELRVDVDSALGARKWDWFRYAKISVYNGGNYQINALELKQVYNLLTDTLSVTIGPMRTSGEKYLTNQPELDKIIVGTSMGKYIVIGYNESEVQYDVLWDSGFNERYAVGAGIWDMEYLNSLTDIPIWHYLSEPVSGENWPDLSLSSGLAYNSWTYGKLNPYTEISGYYLIGTKNGTIIAKNALGDDAPIVQSLLTPIESYVTLHDEKELSAEVLFINNLDFNYYPMIAVAAFNPEAGLLLNPFDFPRATLNFWYRSASNPAALFSNRLGIEDVDLTGEIQAQFGVAKYQPKMRFIDWDGDGDLDMIFSNGQLHYARNMQIELGESLDAPFQLRLIPGYFADINNALKSGGWGQPDVFDIDYDGDLDIVLNYAHKDGTTLFKNTQSSNNPKWEEDKRVFWNWNYDTNIKLNNLTDSRILQNNRGNSWDIYKQLEGETVEPDFVLVSYNRPGKYTWWAEPVYQCIDSYVVATYPEVFWTDFALIQSEDDSFLNFGYQVHEAWSTEKDLEGWTMSINSGDLDGDGKGEIIVGDYDNNVYVFENLVNNTYKRMYRTFDLNHSEQTSESPYLYQELEGISGNFVRKVWDHAEHLLTDIDLDQDGLKELIVATDLQVYAFEDKNLFGGDQLHLIYSLDLRDTSFYNHTGWDQVTKITAMTYGNDLDYNNEQELIIAAGPFLWVFNVGRDNFADTILKDYFLTDYKMKGRYNLIGNPTYTYENRFATIDALISGDTDRDGYKEIILGGTLDTRNIKDNGFVYIYECQGGTFYQAWEAPTSLTEWNPVTDLVLDDQDYDSKQEIIIGHHYGFDMWEWIEGSDSQYLKIEQMTSSPNYPHIPITKFQETQYGYATHPYADMANGQGSQNNKIMYLYILNSYIMWQQYDQITQVWTVAQKLTPSTYDFNDMGSVSYETTPSVISMPDGTYFAVWKMVSQLGFYKNYIAKFSGGVWGTPIPMGIKSVIDYFIYPDVVEFNSTHLLISLVLDYTTLTGAKYLVYTTTQKTLPGTYSTAKFMLFPDILSFDVGSSSMAKIGSDPSSYQFIVAFSAINSKIFKTDYDIWSITFDSSLNFSQVFPHQVTNSFDNQLYPNLAVLDAEFEPLVVVYENQNSFYEEKIGICSSIDGGFRWKRNFELNALFNQIQRIEYPDYNLIEYVNATSGALYYQMDVFGTAITGLDNGGFLYNFFWTYNGDDSWWRYTYNLGPRQLHRWTVYQCYGLNPESDWAYNNLLNVEDLDVGDTDNDGRREVVAGWESQVSTYELKSSTDGSEYMTYRETWLSDIFANEFTALTVYDSNGNGWDEIGIATRRGNVYLYEFPAPIGGKISLLESKELLAMDLGIFAYPFDTLSVDYNGDGNDEFVIIDEMSGKVALLNKTGDVIWSAVHGEGYTRGLTLQDINNDSTPEILFSKENGYLYVINLKTGNQIWNYSNSGGSGGGDIEVISVGDINNASMVEILYCDNAGWLTILDYQGNFLVEYDLGGGTIYSARLGYFTSTTNLTLAYGDSLGVLRVINPLNGTILYESPPSMISAYRTTILSYDVDEDGIDEIIIGGDRLHMVDAVEGTIFYNSTYYGLIRYNLLLDNFDDDEEMEVLVQTFDNGIFLEDIMARQTKWHYTSDTGYIYDMSTGYFGASDHLDVVIARLDGFIVTIDGFTGNLLWFNYTGSYLLSVVALKQSDSNDSLVITTDDLGYLYIFEKQIPQGLPVIEGWKELKIDYSVEMQSLYQEFKIHDFNHDGIDEVAMIQNYTILSIWDYINRKSIFEKDFGEEVVQMWFGQIDGVGTDELLVQLESQIILVIDIETGNSIFDIHPPLNHVSVDILIENFNNDKVGNEIAILFEKNTGTNAVINWYTNEGGQYASSQYNTTSIKNKMIAVNFNSLITKDVALAGYFGAIWIFLGKDGTRIYNKPYASPVVGFYAGDFNNDGFHELVTLNPYGSIRGWDTIGGGSFFSSMDFGIDNVLQIQIGDLMYNDTFGDLVVNYRNVGVVAYKAGASSIIDYEWIYPANLILTQSNCKILVRDHNGDGFADLSFMNYNYWNVVDGSTQRLLWHYQSEDKLFRFDIGRFDKNLKYIGMIYTDGEFLHFVTVNPTDLLLTSIPENYPARNLASLLYQSGIITLTIGIPVLIFGVAVFEIRRKKLWKFPL